MDTKSTLTIEERLLALELRILELEKENALMLRAVAKLTEEKAQAVEDDTAAASTWIPGTLPENSEN